MGNSNYSGGRSYPQPDPEIQEKLRLSLEEALDMNERDLKCPICGFRIASFYGDRSGHIKVKCRKCKFEGVLNLAYFRRMKRNREWERTTVDFPAWKSRGRR